MVELDIPYDDAQVKTYGKAFKSWIEEDIEATSTAIKDAVPFGHLAYVVLVFISSLFRFIIHSLNGRLFNAYSVKIVSPSMTFSLQYRYFCCFITSFSDARHAGQIAWVPAVELMTVATTKPSMRPIFRF